MRCATARPKLDTLLKQGWPKNVPWDDQAAKHWGYAG
jgi:hypothetical protein